MIEVKKLTEYSTETAGRVRELMAQLSRSGKDKGEIPREWFETVIDSPFHDLLVAYDEGRIVGVATMSVVMGAGVGQNAYLEDFVTDASVRGRGVGTAMWEAMCDWMRKKGCRRMEFTCGRGREAAQGFYKSRGAKVYETNFFQFDL